MLSLMKLSLELLIERDLSLELLLKRSNDLRASILKRSLALQHWFIRLSECKFLLNGLHA